LNDLELLRIKYNRKVNLLKDQLKVNREAGTQERELNDHAFQKLSSELNAVRKNLMESTRREGQVINYRTIGVHEFIVHVIKYSALYKSFLDSLNFLLNYLASKSTKHGWKDPWN